MYVCIDSSPTEIYTLSYTTLFRSQRSHAGEGARRERHRPSEHLRHHHQRDSGAGVREQGGEPLQADHARSEEHTSELQSQSNLVCRLLLEKKKKTTNKVNENNITT